MNIQNNSVNYLVAVLVVLVSNGCFTDSVGFENIEELFEQWQNSYNRCSSKKILDDAFLRDYSKDLIVHMELHPEIKPYLPSLQYQLMCAVYSAEKFNKVKEVVPLVNLFMGFCALLTYAAFAFPSNENKEEAVFAKYLGFYGVYILEDEILDVITEQDDKENAGGLVANMIKTPVKKFFSRNGGSPKKVHPVEFNKENAGGVPGTPMKKLFSKISSPKKAPKNAQKTEEIGDSYLDKIEQLRTEYKKLRNGLEYFMIHSSFTDTQATQVKEARSKVKKLFEDLLFGGRQISFAKNNTEETKKEALTLFQSEDGPRLEIAEIIKPMKPTFK